MHDNNGVYCTLVRICSCEGVLVLVCLMFCLNSIWFIVRVSFVRVWCAGAWMCLCEGVWMLVCPPLSLRFLFYYCLLHRMIMSRVSYRMFCWRGGGENWMHADLGCLGSYPPPPPPPRILWGKFAALRLNLAGFHFLQFPNTCVCNGNKLIHVYML